LLCNVCEPSYGIGTWVMPNPVHHSHGLEWTKKQLIWLLLLFNKHNRDHIQNQTHSEISRYGTCNEAYPTQWRVACTKASRKSNFSNDNSDSDEDHGQQEWDNVDCDPTSEASSSSSEPSLLTQEYLNDLVRDLNLSLKKTSWTLKFQTKRVELLHQDTEICFFSNRQNEFKEFFSQENDPVFGNHVCSVTDALRHQHDPNERHLFTDSSKVNVNAVLLCKRNKFPLVPIAYATNLKESYENIKLLLEKIQYEKYN